MWTRRVKQAELVTSVLASTTVLESYSDGYCESGRGAGADGRRREICSVAAYRHPRLKRAANLGRMQCSHLART